MYIHDIVPRGLGGGFCEGIMPSLTPASPKLSPTQTLLQEEEEKHAMMMQHFFTQGSCTDCEVMKKNPFFIVNVRH